MYFTIDSCVEMFDPKFPSFDVYLNLEKQDIENAQHFVLHHVKKVYIIFLENTSIALFLFPNIQK